MPIVISVENISKAYRLGQINTGTLVDDLHVWWAKMRGKPNPLLKIGQEDRTNHDGETIWALKDINIKVDQGEVLGIIGRNGAGKSTLLKILSRVTAPTSGCIKVKGRIASLLEVGTGFHPDLTGRENIYLNGAIFGMTKEEVRRKLDEIVAFSEVEQFIDTPVKRYSSGMYVRLAFAVAAHLEPEILLVDEVLAVGDAEFQKKCLGKMGEVSKEGRTVLFVSHNMGSILNLCPRSILIDKGMITYFGASCDVINKYLDDNVAENQFRLSNATRDGDLRARFCDLKINPSMPRTGLPIDFILTIETSEIQLKPLSVDLSVSIRSEKDMPLLQLASRDMGVVFRVEPGHKKKIILNLPVLPLAPGKYKVNLWMGKGNIRYDWIRESFILTVLSGSFVKETSIMSSNYPLLVPSFWREENYI